MAVKQLAVLVVAAISVTTLWVFARAMPAIRASALRAADTGVVAADELSLAR
jgi:hypothetical protein